MAASRRLSFPVIPILFLSAAVFSACSAPQVNPPDVTIHLVADGNRRDLQLPSGTTVANALAQANIALGDIDRVTPPLYSLLADGTAVQVVRVRETFEVEQIDIPFERQVVRNEALPAEVTRLVQAGKNGRQEITYRLVSEDGVVISRSPLKTVLMESPVAEILMVGAASSFRAVPIKGSLLYVDGGNAWLLSGDTGNRLPLTASGDLDSRVFALSPDRQWLLITRQAEGKINTLEAIPTAAGGKPAALAVQNVIHFAGWSPIDDRTIAYSGVDPVTVFPGWKARNDLHVLTFDAKGSVLKDTELVRPNTEGAYSWWGTDFSWAPDGKKLAYARADEVGWIGRDDGVKHRLLSITPFRTLADSIWLPPVRWSPDGAFLFTVQHGAPIGIELAEDSPVFRLLAVPAAGGNALTLQEQTGMFADPVAGPIQKTTYEQGYNLAFLQSLRPLESDTSKYRLMMSDRDGSNLQAVFPPAGEQGLGAQSVHWSPDGSQIALMYQGNLWIVDLAAGQGQQLTGDGQVTAIDWK
jgi:hypothetical protein